MPRGIYPRKRRGEEGATGAGARETCQEAPQEAQEAPAAYAALDTLCARLSGYVDALERHRAALAAMLDTQEGAALRTLRGRHFAAASASLDLRGILAASDPGAGDPGELLAAAVGRYRDRAGRLAASQASASEAPAVYHYSNLGAYHAAGQAQEYRRIADALAALLAGASVPASMIEGEREAQEGAQ